MKKWYKVEYLTTIKPPKQLWQGDDRYQPKGLTEDELMDDLKVFEWPTPKPIPIKSGPKVKGGK